MALRHNVLLGVDDPILVTVTLNELVLARYVDLAAARATLASRELTVALEDQVAQAKDTPGRLITEAADYVAGEVRRVIAAGAAEAVASAVRDAVAESGASFREQLVEAQVAAREAVTAGRAVVAARNSIFVAAVGAGLAAVIALVALLAVVTKLG